MTVEQQTTDAGRASASTEKLNGPVIASTLAAAIGSLALGLLTTLGEASKSFADTLTFSDRVGPLSGKTTVAVLIYVGSWAALHVALKNRDLSWKISLQASAVLIALGVLLTFPPFFQMFASG